MDKLASAAQAGGKGQAGRDSISCIAWLGINHNTLCNLVYCWLVGTLRADGWLVCVCFSCSNKFQLFMGHAEARLAMQRLGLLLAAVASLSGAAACQTFAGQCVGMISGGEGGQHHVSGGLVRLGRSWSSRAAQHS
jgi:hypothetical protein